MLALALFRTDWIRKGGRTNSKFPCRTLTSEGYYGDRHANQDRTMTYVPWLPIIDCDLPRLRAYDT